MRVCVHTFEEPPGTYYYYYFYITYIIAHTVMLRDMWRQIGVSGGAFLYHKIIIIYHIIFDTHNYAILTLIRTWSVSPYVFVSVTIAHRETQKQTKWTLQTIHWCVTNSFSTSLRQNISPLLLVMRRTPMTSCKLKVSWRYEAQSVRQQNSSARCSLHWKCIIASVAKKAYIIELSFKCVSNIYNWNKYP